MLKISDDLVLFEEHGQLVANLTDDIQVLQVQSLPGIQTMQTSNGTLVQLPWTEDACRFLTNIGIDALRASPVVFNNKLKVEGKYDPMQHQLLTAAFICLHPRCYVLSDPRTGKTGAITIAADYLQRGSGQVTGGWLIITTVTTIPSVWRDSINASCPTARVVVAHGKTREAALATPADFYITNYDSCRLSSKAFIAAVKEGRIGGVIIDELTHVGNSTSQRHKAIYEITKDLTHVVGVTGSPGENPETVFGMCRVVNNAALPCRTKTSWLNMVTYQYGPEPYMRAPTAQAPQVIHKAMQPAIRYRKTDIMDLPPITTQDRVCELSAEQRRMRDEFKAQAIALTKSGEVITAVNGGVLYQKLMQTALGFVMGNDQKVSYLDFDNRLKTIAETIAETQNKVVIFGAYKASIKRLSESLTGLGYTTGVVDGSITGQQRANILKAFQDEKDPHVLICHPTTTAFGVELSAADTIIFDGPPPLGGFIYAQALERLSSVKQKAKQINIIRIAASPEERKFFSTLDKGRETGNFVNELFESYTKGEL